MNQEFKTAKGWSIFIFIFAPLLIALFVFVGIIPFTSEEINWVVAGILIPTSIGMTILMTYGLISTIKGKYIIDSDSITEIGVLKTKRLLIAEIKGYRTDQNYIYLVPNSKELKQIKVSQYIGEKSTFNQWLYQNIDDLNLLQKEEDEQEILSNDDFGRTIEERTEKLKTAKGVVKVLNIVGSILAVLLFFYPNPYQIVTLVALLLPVPILLTLHIFKGLVRVDQKDGSGYPSIAYALLFPGLALALRSLLDFDILNHSNLWLPASAISVTTLFVMLSATNELKLKTGKEIFTVVSLTAILFAYSYGGVINYNCIYDNSEPQFYSSEILEKRISSGKSTSYYIELQPWGPVNEVEEVSISKSLFDDLEIGESVNIYLKKGRMKIPWFWVTKK